ncbi:MAG: hypothetical protein HY221_02265, partial [Candidatus Sungbacteria bacterium]|nr:hypothetical protein [Candidatus Sungbacteria bacterium]
MHHHILHPINWVLALFPEKYLFHALTLKAFLEVSFVGYFAFRIFSLYQQETWAALMLAVVAQLGGFTWFTLTTFIGSHLLLASLIAIYLIVTYESRRRVVTFVLLSLCFFDILMMGHIGYIFAFGIPIIVAFAAKTWPGCVLRPWTGLTPVFITAGFIGVVLASPRLWAVLHGLLYEQLAVSNMWLPSLMGNTGYFVLTGFIPEVMGIHLGDSAAISQVLGIGGRHTQFHNLLYFGVISVIFIYLSLLGALGTRVFTLAILTLFVAITPLYLIQPVSDIFNVLLFPAIHDIIPRTLTAFLILATLVLALRESANDRAKPSEAVMRWFTLVIGLIVAMSLTMGVKVLHENMGVLGPEKWSTIFIGARLALLAVLAISAWIVWKLRFDVDTTRKLSNVAAVVFLIAALVGAAVAFKLRLFSEQWLVLRGFIYTLGAAIWSLVILAFARSSSGENDKTTLYYRLAVAGVVGAAIMILLPLPEMSGQRSIGGNVLAAMMGTLKFILLAFVAIEMVIRWTSGHISRTLFLALITLFTIGDLLFFNKVYSHVGASPFVSAQSIYSPRTVPGTEADLTAWRKSDSLPNLLANPQMHRENGAVQGW